MARELDKGNSIDLTKDNGTSLTSFCVGANWGQIVHRYIWGLIKTYEDVDLDLSCIMTDAQGNMVDHLYSPLYRKYFLAENGLMPGKLVTRDGAMRHSEDDVAGNDGASTNGKELKGVATGVPLCPCPECVRNAVLALGDVLPDAVKE